MIFASNIHFLKQGIFAESAIFEYTKNDFVFYFIIIGNHTINCLRNRSAEVRELLSNNSLFGG